MYNHFRKPKQRSEGGKVLTLSPFKNIPWDLSSVLKMKSSETYNDVAGPWKKSDDYDQ